MSSDVRHHRVSHTFRCRITWLGSQLSPAYWSNDVSRAMGLKPAHSCTLLPRPILRTQHTSGFCKNLFPSLLTAATAHLYQIAIWNLDIFPAAWKASILNLEEFGPSFPPGRLLPFNFEHIESEVAHLCQKRLISFFQAFSSSTPWFACLHTFRRRPLSAKCPCLSSG